MTNSSEVNYLKQNTDLGKLWAIKRASLRYKIYSRGGWRMSRPRSRRGGGSADRGRINISMTLFSLSSRALPAIADFLGSSAATLR